MSLNSFVGCVCIAVMLILLVDCAGGETKRFEATVIDRHYIPAHWYTTIDTDSKGRVHSNLHYKPDEYQLVVRGWAGIETIETSQTGYYSVKPDQGITYTGRVGCLSHYTWFKSYDP